MTYPRYRGLLHISQYLIWVKKKITERSRITLTQNLYFLIMNNSKLDKLKHTLKNLKNEIIQDVPNELAECLVCGKITCTNDKWIKCENRIAHMKCLEESEKNQ